MRNKKITTLFLTISALLTSTTTMGDNTPADTLKVIHQEKSLYRDVQVTANDEMRCMNFIEKKVTRLMGCEFLKTPDKMVYDFTKMLLTSLYINPHPKKILMIGLGIGTMPKVLAKLYPDANMDTAEIDAAVLKVAKSHFDFNETDQNHVFIKDGRMYVKQAIRQGLQYDIVILDAFNSDYIPEHMLTKEFLAEVKQILAPDGVLTANTFSTSGLYPNESATYAAVFGQFYNLDLKKNNRIILAQKNKLLPLETIKANAALLDKSLKPFGVTAEEFIPLFSTQVDWPTDARILTDQYSPANLLNAKH